MCDCVCTHMCMCVAYELDTSKSCVCFSLSMCLRSDFEGWKYENVILKCFLCSQDMSTSLRILEHNFCAYVALFFFFTSLVYVICNKQFAA